MVKDLTERKLVYLDDAIDAANEYFARIGKLKRGGLTIEERAIKLDTIAAIKALPSAQPEIILCRDCRHKPKATRADEKVFYGFSLEFPDEKCPCQCEDGWYNWYPKDDFYCGYAERREE